MKRINRMEMTGPDPDEWDDGLQQPVEWRTPKWFVILILAAVLGCVVLSALALV